MTGTAESSTARSSSGLFGRLLRVAAWAVVAPVVAVLTALGAVFLYFSPMPWAPLRAALAVAFVLCVIASFVVLKPRVKALGVVLAPFAGLLLWYSRRQPPLATLSVAFSAAVLAAYLIINLLPFDSYSIAWDQRQVGILMLYFLAASAPFLFTGWVVASALQPYLDHPSPGIQTVLHQFLHDRSRSIDHLARCDPVDQAVGQKPDATQR